MNAALIFPDSLIDSQYAASLREALGELGLVCSLNPLVSEERAAEDSESLLGKERPSIVLVPTGMPGEELPGDLIPFVSEIAHVADYMCGRAALFGITAERSPELFLAESRAVVITGEVALGAARLAALPEWGADSLRCLPGLIFKEAGRLVRA